MEYRRRFEGRESAAFEDKETNILAFTIEPNDAGFIHIDKFHIKRLHDIIIHGGEFDGVVLVKGLELNKLEAIVSSILNKINNDSDLRRIVAYFTSRNVGKKVV